MKQNKKWLALLITISMVLSLVPATVMADVGAAVADAPAAIVSLAKADPEENPSGDPAATNATEQNPTFTTEAEIVSYLKAKMLARESTVEFTYSPTPYFSGNLNEFGNSLVKKAEVHTGVGNEGDYLKYHMDESSWSLDGTTAALHFTYHLAYNSSAEDEAEISTAIREVFDELNIDNISDEYLKFIAIYDYIVRNVSYDYAHLGDKTYRAQFSAHAALVDGTAVCQGYANLLYRMLLEAGMDCRIIAGDALKVKADGSPMLDANGEQIKEGHAWNIVRINGVWYNVDATWDSSGCIDYTPTAKYYPMSWRLKSEADFPRHVREDEYLTEDFLRDYPISSNSYEVSPRFIGHDVILENNIALTYFVDIPEGIDTNTITVEFEISDGRVIGPFSFDENDGYITTNSGKSYYKFVCSTNALEIADTITAIMHYNIGGTEQTVIDTYSVLQYCTYIRKHANTYGAKAVSLVNALQDYGHYLQGAAQYGWTDGNRHNTVDAVTTIDDSTVDLLKDDQGLSGFAFVKPTNSSVDRVMYSLTLGSTISINIYLKFKSSSTSLPGADEVTISGETWYKYAPLSNIGPTNLDSTAPVLGNSDGSVCALSYVYGALNSNLDAAKKYVMAALYNYYLAAEAYIV